MKKLTKLFFLFLLLSSSSIKINAFEYDGVEYFINEEEERIGAYTFEIKGVPYSYTYSVIKESGEYYFPIFEFIKILDLKNYEYNNGILTISFGDINDKRVINLKKLDKKLYIYEDNDFYLREDIFKEYFFEEFRINEENFIVKTKPNFVLPNELSQMLKNQTNKLKEEAEKEVLYYQGERSLFDIGNLRIDLEKEVSKAKGERKKYDWRGNLEYSGSLLYGNLLTDYDLKEDKFGDIELTYHDIKEDYELNLGIYGEDREKGFTFRKDKGYYQAEGREYIIEERVPIGSRVELLYNNFPIDIQDEENGKVTFINNLIKSGREFTLKVYEQDGKIIEKKIKINEDYNQQKRGEFGYDLYFREDKESNKNNSDLNIYYGYTDNLTFGLSYKTTPEIFEDRYIYNNDLGGEVIYSNSLDGNPFTLSYSYEEALNNEKNEEINYREKNRHKMMFDIDIRDFSFNYEQYNNGKYYDEKREIYIDADYDITENLSITGNMDRAKYYENKKEDIDYYYGFEYSKSWKRLLVSYEFQSNKSNDKKHNLDFYYTGFKDFTVRIENTYDDENKLESELKINNTKWLDNLDLSIGAKYSQEKKTQFMFEFTLKLDNWLEFGNSYERHGDRRTYIGIDRVVNLKNPIENMNSLENTVIKAVAFLDKNDNNIMDKDEERVEGVEVTLGERKVITNENGIGYIYGIPSYIDYDLEAKSMRPSHDSKATKIKVRGLGSSEIKTYIPIKPLITFMGNIDFSKDDSILQDVRIKIVKISNPKINKVVYVEPTGEFYIDDLTPGKYRLEIEYLGDEYKINTYNSEIDLSYTDENGGENYFDLELEEKKDD